MKMHVVSTFTVLLALLYGSAHAQLESAIDFTPDATRYLISKDVGDERWAISFNLDDRTITGNVFRTSGGAPTFLWCRITDEIPSTSPAETQYVLDCFASDGCNDAPCTPQRWAQIASGITIGGDFLLPSGTESTLRGNVAPIVEQSCATTEACHDGGKALGGLNLKPKRFYEKTVLVEAGQPENPDIFYVEPFAPNASYLVQKLLGEGLGSPMPRGGPPLADDEFDSIRTWILEGAADN